MHKDFSDVEFYYEKNENGLQYLLPIRSFAEWEHAFQPKKNWKEGRSACSLAHFFTEQNGLKKVLSKLSYELSRCLADEDQESLDWFDDDKLKDWIEVDKCIIEKTDIFDEYPNPRQQDMVIYGSVLNKRFGKQKFKIAIEAKVDEPFGSTTIEEALSASIRNPHSNVHHRIDNLLEKIGIDLDSPIRDSSHYLYRDRIRRFGGCRYQLLHYLAGSFNEYKILSENESAMSIQKEYQMIIMLVLVFKTHLYDKARGDQNFNDFRTFVEQFNDIYWNHESTETRDNELICYVRPLNPSFYNRYNFPVEAADSGYAVYWVID